jgi:hypothetical protein
VDKKPTQVQLKPPSSRQEELEKKPFPWRKRQLEKECATSHSNMLVEAWKRATKR